LTRLCPEAEDPFSRFGPDDWARQHRMLKEAVLLLFVFRQQNESEVEPNVLTRIASSHHAIPSHIYDRFVDALIHTVCGKPSAGLPPFDPECVDSPAQSELIEDHWRKSIAPGVAYMKTRASAAPAAPA
jgi:hypothetical protein